MIESKEGYVFALKDKSAIYENLLCLGIYDSIDNYIELPIEEANKLKEALENDRPE